MVVQFVDNAGTNITPSSVTADGDRVTGGISGTTATIAVACQAGTVPANGNQRDAFPDCFQGDEVHFEMTYVPCSTPASCSYTTILNNWFSQVTGFGHP